MNSLKLKFLGLTGLILILAIVGTTWYNLRTQKTMLQNMAAEHARLVVETIRNSIMTDMATGRNDQVAHSLARISREPAIDSLRIFDESGRIMISGDAADLGDLVVTAELLAFRTGNLHYLDNTGDSEHYNAMLPIENGPTCHSCHGSEKTLLGVLSLKLSLDELAQMQISSRDATMIASAAILLILVLSISIFLLTYVDAPIRKLITAMEHAERGEFNLALTNIDSSDEMKLLSEKYNFMVQRLQESIEATIRNERDMAISKEKMAHAEEVQALNATLAERLKEIESLNLSLEERIEEIEQANLKITDLASELEGKNVRLSQAIERLHVQRLNGVVELCHHKVTKQLE